jgi:uncharacterized membrane protein
MAASGAQEQSRTQQRSGQRWRRGGVLIGLGIGGFFDGIVLHQLLQWHHLVSEVYPPTTLKNLQLNTVADGLFHLAAYVFVLLGLLLLWSGLRRGRAMWRTSAFVGTLLFGFGLFNVTEGLINHQILGIHHVRPGPQWLAYDVGFLVWGAAMLLLGWRLMRDTQATP